MPFLLLCFNDYTNIIENQSTIIILINYYLFSKWSLILKIVIPTSLTNKLC